MVEAMRESMSGLEEVRRSIAEMARNPIVNEGLRSPMVRMEAADKDDNQSDRRIEDANQNKSTSDDPSTLVD